MIDPNSIGLKCKHCGCTQDNACDVDGKPCFWVIFCGISASLLELDPEEALDGDGFVDPSDSVCSNPECVEKEYRALTGQLRSAGTREGRDGQKLVPRLAD